MPDDRFLRLARARIEFALSPFPRVRHRWERTPPQGGTAPFPILAIEGSRDGFDLVVAFTPDGVLVLCPTPDGNPEGWHSHAWRRDAWETEAALLDDLIAFITLALSPRTRLKVSLRRGVPVRWRMEVREGEKWEGWEEVRLPSFPSWGRKKEVILQNDLVALPLTPCLSGRGEKPPGRRTSA